MSPAAASVEREITGETIGSSHWSGSTDRVAADDDDDGGNGSGSKLCSFWCCWCVMCLVHLVAAAARLGPRPVPVCLPAVAA